LLANHIADEVIELIAVKSFVQPWPWEAPANVQTGFLRTLFWLSRWDWKAEPLIVDMSGTGELKPSETQSIQTQFEAWRKLDPAMNRVVLFAASNVDRDGTTWTDGLPAKVVTGRMTALARAACAETTEKQLHVSPATLFESSIGDFDVIIRFDPIAVGQKQQRKRSGTNGVAFKNLELDLINDTSRVGLDPFSSFLKELEDLYRSAILCFSGWPEKPVVAGLWNPQTARRPWKLNLAYSTTPIKDTASAGIKADVNKESILAEIARLGGDMIRSIEVNR
jgi:U3 small nucleolar RNA-associated protein 22